MGTDMNLSRRTFIASAALAPVACGSLSYEHGIPVPQPNPLPVVRSPQVGQEWTYIKKDVFEVRNPADAFLPKQHVSTSFVFIKEDKFFAYPNNFNHYVGYYRNTFQHGGLSLEEMIIPFITLSAK